MWTRVYDIRLKLGGTQVSYRRSTEQTDIVNGVNAHELFRFLRSRALNRSCSFEFSFANVRHHRDVFIGCGKRRSRGGSSNPLIPTVLRAKRTPVPALRACPHGVTVARTSCVAVTNRRATRSPWLPHLFAIVSIAAANLGPTAHMLSGEESRFKEAGYMLQSVFHS
jgi:hypothetical protein